MKQKTKTKIKKIIDSTAEDFTKTKPLLALGSFIIMTFFIMIFALSWVGIKENLFEGYFQLLVILFLGYISFNVSNFHISDNGYLGLANGFYLFFGIMGIVSGEFSIVELGANMVRIVCSITIGSFIYIYVKENLGGLKRWLLKFRKQ